MRTFNKSKPGLRRQQLPKKELGMNNETFSSWLPPFANANVQSPLKVVLSQGAMSPLHMSVEIHIDTMFVSLRLLYQCFQSTNNAEQTPPKENMMIILYMYYVVY